MPSLLSLLLRALQSSSASGDSGSSKAKPDRMCCRCNIGGSSGRRGRRGCDSGTAPGRRCRCRSRGASAGRRPRQRQGACLSHWTRKLFAAEGCHPNVARVVSQGTCTPGYHGRGRCGGRGGRGGPSGSRLGFQRCHWNWSSRGAGGGTSPTPSLGSPWQQIILPSWLSPNEPSVEMIEPLQIPWAVTRLVPAKVKRRGRTALSCMAKSWGGMPLNISLQGR
jgi:hypothetical protein